MKFYLELIILLPLLGGTANIILGGRIISRRWSEIIACAVIWGSFAAALAAAAAYNAPVTVEIASWLKAFNFNAPMSLYLDPLSLALCLMVTFVCGLIHSYSVGYMRDDSCYVRFFSLLNLFVAAMLLLILAENLPLLYLGWEGVGFCSYALIGFWYDKAGNATAGRKAFIVTRIGDIGLGLAVVWLFHLCGTVSIQQINRMGTELPLSAITGIGLLLLLGAMGKSAQAPLMVWLPDAMAGPTPVSAQIHAATMVTAGVYLLMRLFPLIGISHTVTAAIAVTGALTAFYGATCALVQRDLKRILAFSTISQIGYMMLGVGAGAITAATFHLIIHAFFKALLFLGAGCVITAMHHEQDIFRMGGLRRSMPATFYSFLAGAVCLAGLPLTGGFFSKDSILAAVWQYHTPLYGVLYAFGLMTALITAYYTFRMLYLIFWGDGPNPHPIPSLMQWPLIPLAILGVGGGLLNIPAYFGQGILEQLLSPLNHESKQFLSHSTELALQGVAAIISLTGVWLAWYWFGGDRRDQRLAEADLPLTGLKAFLFNGWYVDDLYRQLFIRPYVWLSEALWLRVDENLIDGSLDRFAAMLGHCGQNLGSWSCGRVSVYLYSLATGVALILAWLAWVTL